MTHSLRVAKLILLISVTKYKLRIAFHNSIQRKYYEKIIRKKFAYLKSRKKNQLPNNRVNSRNSWCTRTRNEVISAGHFTKMRSLIGTRQQTLRRPRSLVTEGQLESQLIKGTSTSARCTKNWWLIYEGRLDRRYRSIYQPTHVTFV